MRGLTYEAPYLTQTSEEVGTLDFFFCRIGGHTWRYTLVTPEQMLAVSEDLLGEEGSECPGMCALVDRIIYIRNDSIHHNVIIHELVHAFKDATHTSTASLGENQTEEVCCEIFAYNWWRILRLAHQIHYNLSLLAEIHAGASPDDIAWETQLHDEASDSIAEELQNLMYGYNENGINIFASPQPPITPPSRLKAKKRTPKRRPKKSLRRKRSAR